MAPNAKTSECQRAGPKKWGGRGPPPRLLASGLSPRESLDPRPGPGGEPTSQVLTCDGPNRTTLPGAAPPRRQNSILCLQGRIPLCYDYREYGNLIQKEPCRRPSGRQRIDTMEINGMEVELDLRYSEMNLSQGILQALNQKGLHHGHPPSRPGPSPASKIGRTSSPRPPPALVRPSPSVSPWWSTPTPKAPRVTGLILAPHPGAGPPDPGRNPPAVRLPAGGSGWPASTAASPSTGRSTS